MSNQASGAGKKAIPVVCFLLICFGFSGCVDYRLGSTLPPGIRSVRVPIFVNNSGEPLVETETTQATIQEFQKDGTLRVVNDLTADSLLEVTLTDYKLESIRYEKDRAKTTREYRLKITATITLKKTRTKEVMLERKVQGEATFEPTGDLSSAKKNAIPEAARDLAHDIVESVVEYW